MPAYTHLYACIQTDVYTYAHMHRQISTWAGLHISVHLPVYCTCIMIVIHMSTTYPYTDIHTYKSTCNVHTCIYIFIYTCIHLCMHTYTHICIYNVHKYTYGRSCTPVTGSAHSCPSLKQLSQKLILTLMGAFLPLRVYLPGSGGPVHKSVCCASMMTQVQILHHPHQKPGAVSSAETSILGE